MRSKWTASEPAIGAWLTLGSPSSAEVVARSGFDYICIDTQHGLNDYTESWRILQVINLGASTPIVRVPWNEPGIIGKSLDAGARGVIIPMVNTRDHAEAATYACRYAPVGGRSFGPARALRQEGPDYFEHANDDVAVIPMIETVEALGNLDDILSVPGVDAIYIGPADLSISLGLPPGNNDGEPAFDDAYAAILAGCERHDVVPGCHTTADLVGRRIDQGFRMITATNDAVALGRAIDEDLATARGDKAEGSDSIY